MDAVEKSDVFIKFPTSCILNRYLHEERNDVKSESFWLTRSISIMLMKSSKFFTR
jgi:hypothetical protein